MLYRPAADHVMLCIACQYKGTAGFGVCVVCTDNSPDIIGGRMSSWGFMSFTLRLFIKRVY